MHAFRSCFTGQALLSLFSTPDNYLKNPLLRKAAPIDNQGKVNFVLDQLESGIYSVSIIYDEDKNGKLNTGFLRIPKELVGFSNNAKSTFGPPAFKDTSFKLSGDLSIDIFLLKARD